MQRLAMMATLQDDEVAIRAYERYHQSVWPEVLADNRRGGVTRTVIFRHGPTLFMFLEADDTFRFDTFGAYLSHDRTREWLGLMDALMVDPTGTVPGLKWTELHRVCDIQMPEHS